VTPTVIGFDGSLSAAGLAIWHDGLWTFDTVHSPSSMPAEQRWRVIAGRLWPRITGHTLVVVEGVYAGAKGRTALDLAMLHGVIRDGLHGRHVPFAVPNNRSVKLFATGGGNAAKQEMVDTARARLGIAVSDHNQADAAWAAALGLHHYGRPLCPITTAQRAAVTATDWPAWRLGVPVDA
jgi:Holliday junction resolvasome RuvABC endonuclease subunit